MTVEYNLPGEPLARGVSPGRGCVRLGDDLAILADEMDEDVVVALHRRKRLPGEGDRQGLAWCGRWDEIGADQAELGVPVVAVFVGQSRVDLDCGRRQVEPAGRRFDEEIAERHGSSRHPG